MIPHYMREGIARYIEHGILPGNFLQAIISNDLRKAVESADSINIHLIPEYVRFFYNEAPINCWGSKEKMEEWVKSRREERNR